MNVPRVLLALALVGASSSAAAQPSAQPPADPVPIPTRLSYVVAPGSHGCPREATFRGIAVEHLHLRGAPDPFTDAGANSQRIGVEVSADGRGYKVVLTLYDAAGKILDKFDPWRADTCIAAAEEAGGAIRQWLLPFVPVKKAASSEVSVADAPKAESPTRAELPPEDPQAAPAAAPKPRPPIFWRAGAMGRVDLRPGTAPAFGVVADLGFKVSIFSLAAQFHAVPSAAFASYSSSAVYAGGLVACVRAEGKLPLALAVCGIGELGTIQYAGAGSYGSTLPANPFGGGGGRLELEIPVTGILYLRAAGDFEGLRGAALFRGTVPAGGAGAGAGLSF